MSIERLTLIEQPYPQLPPEVQERVWQASHLPLGAAAVVGMQLREQPDMFLRGYRPTGTEYRRELYIQSAHARRISRYFFDYHVSPHGRPVDAEAFMRFTLGTDNASMHSPEKWQRLEHSQESHTEFELGKGYVFINHTDSTPHIAYGLDDPRLCLVSFGLNNPPVVAHIQDVAAWYKTRRIAQVVLRSEKLSQNTQ